MKQQVKQRRPFLMNIAVKTGKLFMGRRQVICTDGQNLPQRFILLATHNGLSGPIIYHSYLPMFCVPWGAHEMLGNYRQRWNYLYHVFYRQKMHFNRFSSFMRATFLGIVSKFFYKGAGLIGTYRDGRQIGAIKRSIEMLNHNVPVLIFPEQSDNGYSEVPQDIHAGFVLLSKIYYRQFAEDLPVYPSYYCKKHRKIVIGKPLFVNKMLDNGHDKQSICQTVCDEVMRLYQNFGKEGVPLTVNQ